MASNFIRFRKYLFLLLLFSSELFAESTDPDMDVEGAEIDTPSDWLLFIGRFHPLVVHLPIGFVTILFVIEILLILRMVQVSAVFVRILTVITALSAIVSVIIGLMLAESGGYSPELLEAHEETGELLMILTIALVGLKFLEMKMAWISKIYSAGVFAAMVLLAVVGHYGGSLTHGDDYLSEYWPFRAKIVPKKIATLSDAIVYDDVIKPILDKKCTSCHNAGKIKGGLNLESYESIMKGGESGKSIVPGKPEESQLYKLVTMDRTDEGAMPPEGKPALTDMEIKILRWWIATGAVKEKNVTQLALEPEIEATLKKYLIPGEKKKSLIAGIKVDPANEKDIEKAKQNGFLVLPLSKNKSLLQAQFREPEKATDAELSKLDKFGDQLVWLDLANTQITDAGLDKLSSFKNLNKLYLQNTRVTDAGLAKLKGFEKLEYLNLYGDTITDAGLKSLGELKNLRHLFVWQTKVTESGMKELRTKLPEIKIELGGIPEIKKDTTAIVKM